MSYEERLGNSMLLYEKEQISLSLRSSSKSKPKRPENAFFNMFFLAHWQVVARGNHSFAQTVLRHDERWACMLCGVTPSNCFFDLLVLVIILFFGQ